MVLNRCVLRFLLLFYSSKIFIGSCIVRHRTIFIHLPKSIPWPTVDDNVGNETSRRGGCCSSLSLQMPYFNDIIQEKRKIENQLYTITKVDDFDAKYKLKETGSDNDTSMNIFLHREKDFSWKVNHLQSYTMITLP